MPYVIELMCNAQLEYTVCVWLPGNALHIPVKSPADGLELIRDMIRINRGLLTK